PSHFPDLRRALCCAVAGCAAHWLLTDAGVDGVGRNYSPNFVGNLSSSLRRAPFAVGGSVLLDALGERRSQGAGSGGRDYGCGYLYRRSPAGISQPDTAQAAHWRRQLDGQTGDGPADAVGAAQPAGHVPVLCMGNRARAPGWAGAFFAFGWGS